ncbi:MAG: two-component regulator propeller domain-containing protein, partial [Bacteroidota bacterium]
MMKKIYLPIFLLFFTCWTSLLQAQYRFDNYTHLTTSDGLPSNNVYDFAEDKYGFIWIATSRGLVRYDGSKVSLLKPNEQDSVFLASEYITALLVSGDSLWIGTQKGLSILDLEHGTISNHQFQSKIKIEESAAHKGREFLVRDIYEDRQGNIWIAQQFSGFVQWERATQRFHDFPLFPDENLPSVYSQRDQTTLISIIQDREQDSIMWAASMAGIVRLNIKTGEIKRVLFKEEELYQFNRKICIHQDGNGTIYTGSWHSGLSIYHPDNEEYIAPAYHLAEQLPHELKKNHLFAIAKGKDEQLYFTFWYGLYTYDQQSGQFQLIKQSDYKGSANVGFGIDFIDSEGRIWYGSGGVVIADPMVHQFQWYDLSELNPTNLRSNQRALVEDFYEGYISVSGQYMNGIYHVNPSTGHTFKDAFTPDMMTEDILSAWGMSLLDENTLLISTEDALYNLDNKSRRFTPYLLDLPLEYGALKENSVDQNGIAWLGTSRDGLLAVDTKRKKVMTYRDVVPYSHVYHPFEDSVGNVWMLTNTGHLVHDRKRDKIHIFDSNTDTTSTFLVSGNFCECPNGEVWLAGHTDGFGLVSSTAPEKGIIQKIIPTNSARANIRIQAIACNSKNELWAIDNDVIIKINRANWTYELFQLDYGVKRWFSLFQFLKNDQLFIGGNDGFYLLDTEHLKTNQGVPKPYVSK